MRRRTKLDYTFSLCALLCFAPACLFAPPASNAGQTSPGGSVDMGMSTTNNTTPADMGGGPTTPDMTVGPEEMGTVDPPDMCVPQTDDEYCAAVGGDVECGFLIDVDRCGNERFIDCGFELCAGGESCNENRCEQLLIETDALDGDGREASLFGYTVAASEAFVAVGAPTFVPDDVGTTREHGGVEIFARSVDGSFESIQVLAEPGGDGSLAGFSLDMEENLLVVGLPKSETSGRGGVFVYEWSEETGEFEYTRVLRPEVDGWERANCGWSVDLEIDDDTGVQRVLVGCPGVLAEDASGSQLDEGLVALYERRPDDRDFSLAHEFQARELEVGARFGFDVALDGDVILIGAPFADDGAGGVTDTGLVGAFRENNGRWMPAGRVQLPAKPDGALFGSAIDIEGDAVIIGAPGDRGGAGSVHVFEVVEGPLRLIGSFDGQQVDGSLGTSVLLIDEERAVVGSPGANNGQGRAVELARNGSAIEFLRAFEVVPSVQGTWLGFSLAAFGPMLVVGAPGAHMLRDYFPALTPMSPSEQVLIADLPE